VLVTGPPPGDRRSSCRNVRVRRALGAIKERSLHRASGGGIADAVVP
jgi:hypothetical protein